MSSFNKRVDDKPRPIITLCGFPSAGKTTVCNALAKKRYGQTGTSRTTFETTCVGVNKIEGVDKWFNHPLTSDDNYEFNIIDCPGLSDTKDDHKFEETTEAMIKKSDIMIWVTPVESAFVNRHEKGTYDHLVSVLSAHTKATYKLHKHFILVTKVDFLCDKSTKTSMVLEDGEIAGYEDSDYGGNVEHVKKLYDAVYLFNSFGRIAKYGSGALKQIVKTCPTNINIEFNLGKYLNNFADDQETLYTKGFINLLTTTLKDNKYRSKDIAIMKHLSPLIDHSAVKIKYQAGFSTEAALLIESEIVNDEFGHMIDIIEDPPINEQLIFTHSKYGMSDTTRKLYFELINKLDVVSYTKKVLESKDSILSFNINLVAPDYSSKFVFKKWHDLDIRLSTTPTLAYNTKFIAEVAASRQELYNDAGCVQNVVVLYLMGKVKSTLQP